MFRRILSWAEINAWRMLQVRLLWFMFFRVENFLSLSRRMSESFLVLPRVRNTKNFDPWWKIKSLFKYNGEKETKWIFSEYLSLRILDVGSLHLKCERNECGASLLLILYFVSTSKFTQLELQTLCWVFYDHDKTFFLIALKKE